jgi:hypothetical protein
MSEVQASRNGNATALCTCYYVPIPRMFCAEMSAEPMERIQHHIARKASHRNHACAAYHKGQLQYPEIGLWTATFRSLHSYYQTRTLCVLHCVVSLLEIALLIVIANT